MEQQADDSHLGRIYAARDKNRHAEPVTVRVVEYTLTGSATVYRLITTILDPAQAPATGLAALYARRSEPGTSLDELKTPPGRTTDDAAANPRRRAAGGLRLPAGPLRHPLKRRLLRPSGQTFEYQALAIHTG